MVHKWYMVHDQMVNMSIPLTVWELRQHIRCLIQTLLQFLLHHHPEHKRNIRLHGQLNPRVVRRQLFELNP